MTTHEVELYRGGPRESKAPVSCWTSYREVAEAVHADELHTAVVRYTVEPGPTIQVGPVWVRTRRFVGPRGDVVLACHRVDLVDRSELPEEYADIPDDELDEVLDEANIEVIPTGGTTERSCWSAVGVDWQYSEAVADAVAAGIGLILWDNETYDLAEGDCWAITPAALAALEE